MLRVLLIASLLLVSGCDQEGVEVRQVYVGVNGPAAPHFDYLLDQAALEKSWVKPVLDETQWRALLSTIDFNREMLLALAVGERENASGTVKISRAYIYTGVADRPLNINAKIGVLGDACKGLWKVSAPFTLVVIPKSAYSGASGGYDIANFPDGCRALAGRY
ncbi:MAG TPA: hypothetical protein VGC21_19710 [Telluria sp.]|jgi:hypothetical protein